MNSDELSFGDFIGMLWHWKWLIIVLTMLFSIGSYTYAISLPPVYKSECRVLPVGQSGGGSSGALAQLAAFSDLLPRGASNGQLMLSIIRGDVVIDSIINRFGLRGNSLTAARKMVVNKLQTSEESRSGILIIGVVDENPVRAAEMANAFVDELQNRVRALSLTQAVSQRTFFEEYLKEGQARLDEAEKALQQYQLNKGVVLPETQIRELMAAITRLRSQISAKNIEIASLETYAERSNPQLKRAQSQLEAMIKELNTLEEQSRNSGLNEDGEGVFSLSQTLESEREYQHLKRDLQLASTMYETLLRRFESARLNEMSSFSPLQVIDPATPSDIPYGQSKRRIVMKWSAIGLFLGCAWAFMFDYVRKLLKL